ncbi:MAG: MBL fold metallo-hydrolase [Armatimonadota bacterium]|jgi:glyoxylase-like metal-dependent hydrolase (beta-lactamase superfamily II)
MFEEGKVSEIAPGVFVRHAVDNCTWAVLDDFVLIVDALEQPQLAGEVLDHVRDTTGKPVRYLAITHWHGDHTACNVAFAEAGATIIAHESTAPAKRGAGDGNADITFGTSLSIQGGPRTVELHHAGGTHTPGDIALLFPWGKVLCVGDLFGWGLIPLHRITEQSAAILTGIMQRLVDFDADVIVPGHGPTATTADLRRFMEYFQGLLQEVPAALRAGKSAEQIQTDMSRPDDMLDWWRFDWKHPHNVEQVARQCG